MTGEDLAPCQRAERIDVVVMDDRTVVDAADHASGAGGARRAMCGARRAGRDAVARGTHRSFRHLSAPWPLQALIARPLTIRRHSRVYHWWHGHRNRLRHRHTNRHNISGVGIDVYLHYIRTLQDVGISKLRQPKRVSHYFAVEMSRSHFD